MGGFTEDRLGRTELHRAAEEGRATRCRLLVAQGHSPSALDNTGMRPADLSRLAGHHGLAVELEHMCDLETKDIVRTKQSEARQLDFKELVALLRGDESAVETLIATGRIMAIDAKGDTALHICAAKGRLHLCDILIRAGADPLQENFDGLRPDQRALENGNHEVALLLGKLIGIEPQHASTTDNAGPREPEIRVPQEDEEVEEVEEDTFDTSDLLFDDDLELDFEATEDADIFHAGLDLEEHHGHFEGFEGQVTGLTSDDADEDDESWGEFRVAATVRGEGMREDRVTSGESPEARIRNFLDVRKGRQSSLRTSAPTTAFFSLDPRDAGFWLDGCLEAGSCSRDDIADLVGLCRGSFDAPSLAANLSRELESLGLFDESNEIDLTGAAAIEVERDAILDLLVSLCTRSNIRPGLLNYELTRRAEARLIRRLRRSMAGIERLLVEHAPLLEVVLTLGERVVSGTLDPRLVFDLDVQPGRTMDDMEVLVSAMDRLAAWREALDSTTSRLADIKEAQMAIAAMRLTPKILEVIAAGISDAPHLADLHVTMTERLQDYRAARDEILVSMLPAVRRIAARRAGPDLEVDDLLHDGLFGLSRSLETFDPELGFRLGTYAQFRIRQVIARAIDDTGSAIRIPSHAATRLRTAERAAQYLPLDLSEDDRAAKLCEGNDFTIAEVKKLFGIPRHPVPLDEASLDGLAQEQPEPWEAIFVTERADLLKAHLGQLSERQQDVLARRFGLWGHDEMTLEEVGTIYGVTRERIRQIEAKALERLRHPARVDTLRGLL